MKTSLVEYMASRLKRYGECWLISVGEAPPDLSYKGGRVFIGKT